MSERAQALEVAVQQEGSITMDQETTTTCGARHVTGVVCELPRGHAENHRGEDSHCSAQWPVERKPTTLELSGTMPDVSHYARCARCGGSGREEDASHTPAVSGEGDRLKDAAEAFRAIALDALACWQGEDETQDDKHKRTRSAQARTLLRHRLHSANGMLRASTPTPGAPR